LSLTANGPFPKIILKNITKETEKVIFSLHSKNSSRYDEISTRTLKISAPYISSTLCYVFKKAVSVGQFPSYKKYSTVTPIYCANYANYRKISLLTSFSKVFEKLIFRRLLTYVHTYDILVNEQFGFCPKLSTEIATYNLINKVLTAIIIKEK
jgi:hypothetical protein